MNEIESLKGENFDNDHFLVLTKPFFVVTCRAICLGREKKVLEKGIERRLVLTKGYICKRHTRATERFI